MNTNYDSSWDLQRSSNGYLPCNEELFDNKLREWKRRNWIKWLKANLIFPFEVKREEDEDDAYFTDVAEREPFRLGHRMEALELLGHIPRYGILIRVMEGKKIGSVPLADVKVTSKSDPNYWPVREYVVWMANRW